MEIVVERLQLEPLLTIGSMSIDGQWECWTLEDTVRPPEEPKVPGMTAIPAGRNEVKITHSPCFQRPMPLLLDVRRFSGIRIHPGNVPGDTEGCILVGQWRFPDRIGKSRAAYDTLMVKLGEAFRQGQRVWISLG